MFINIIAKLVICLLCTRYVLAVPTANGAAAGPVDTQDESYELAKSILSAETSTPLPDLDGMVNTAISLLETELQNTLNQDLYPTLHSALMAPFNLMARLIRDGLKFYEHKSLTHLFSMGSLRSALTGAPQHLTRYWRKLMDMEHMCLLRTICDMTAFLGPRMPFWANQLSGVYFTSYSSDNVYYRAAANGVINRNCGDYYGQCSLTGGS